LRGEGYATIEEIQCLIQERNSMLDELKMHLDQAQQRMKMYADKKRREVEFQRGDRVFLKIQPYRMKILARKLNKKLSARFYGPCEILERIRKVTYKLKLTNSTCVHPVFHVSLLKKCIKPDTPTQPLPSVRTGWELLVELAQVLAK